MVGGVKTMVERYALDPRSPPPKASENGGGPPHRRASWSSRWTTEDPLPPPCLSWSLVGEESPPAGEDAVGMR